METSAGAPRVDHALVDSLEATAEDDCAGIPCRKVAHPALLRQRLAAWAHQQAARTRGHPERGLVDRARSTSARITTLPARRRPA